MVRDIFSHSKGLVFSDFYVIPHSYSYCHVVKQVQHQILTKDGLKTENEQGKGDFTNVLHSIWNSSFPPHPQRELRD